MAEINRAIKNRAAMQIEFGHRTCLIRVSASPDDHQEAFGSMFQRILDFQWTLV